MYRISRRVISIMGVPPKECFMPGVAIKGERICNCTTQCNYYSDNINKLRVPPIWTDRHLGLRPLLSEKEKALKS